MSWLTKQRGPLRSGRNTRRDNKIVMVAVPLLLLWVWYMTPGGSADVSVERPTACGQDLQCWGDQHTAAAAVYCKSPIEDLAAYAVRWTDGILEPKFSQFGWMDKGRRWLTYRGHAIEFQTGLGAWQKHVYECDYDPVTEQVLSVRAVSGNE